MGLSCPVCQKYFSRKDIMKRYMNSQHSFSGFAPSQVLRMLPGKCQQFHLVHPFISMVAGMTGSGKTLWVQSLLQRAQNAIHLAQKGFFGVILSGNSLTANDWWLYQKLDLSRVSVLLWSKISTLMPISETWLSSMTKWLKMGAIMESWTCLPKDCIIETWVKFTLSKTYFIKMCVTETST